MQPMTKDEIRAQIELNRLREQAPGSFNALADAVGVERSTMRAALAPNGTLSKSIAEKCSAHLRGLAK